MTMLSIVCLPAQAFAYSVEIMTITDGSLTWTDSFGNPLYSSPLTLTPGPAATVDDGLINGAIDADGLHGSAGNPVVSALFFGMPINGFFAHSATTCVSCSNPTTCLTPTRTPSA